MDGLLREIRKWTNRLNYGKQLQRGHCDRNDDHRIGRRSVGRGNVEAADVATKMKGADMENVGLDGGTTAGEMSKRRMLR